MPRSFLQFLQKPHFHDACFIPEGFLHISHISCCCCCCRGCCCCCCCCWGRSRETEKMTLLLLAHNGNIVIWHESDKTLTRLHARTHAVWLNSLMTMKDCIFFLFSTARLVAHFQDLLAVRRHASTSGEREREREREFTSDPPFVALSTTIMAKKHNKN